MVFPVLVAEFFNVIVYTDDFAVVGWVDSAGIDAVGHDNPGFNICDHGTKRIDWVKSSHFDGFLHG